VPIRTEHLRTAGILGASVTSSVRFVVLAATCLAAYMTSA